MKLSEHNIGLVVGAFAGTMHLLWSLIVAFDYAQSLLDWILGLHFLNNPYQVQPFNLTNAIILVVVQTFVNCTQLTGFFQPTYISSRLFHASSCS